MHDEEIRMNFAGLSNTATDIGQVARSMQGHLEYLVSEVRRVAEEWDGETKQAFLYHENRLHQAIEQIANSQTNTAAAVTNAGQTMQDIDRRNHFRV